MIDKQKFHEVIEQNNSRLYNRSRELFGMASSIIPGVNGTKEEKRKLKIKKNIYYTFLTKEKEISTTQEAKLEKEKIHNCCIELLNKHDVEKHGDIEYIVYNIIYIMISNSTGLIASIANKKHDNKIELYHQYLSLLIDIFNQDINKSIKFILYILDMSESGEKIDIIEYLDLKNSYDNLPILDKKRIHDMPISFVYNMLCFPIVKKETKTRSYNINSRLHAGYLRETYEDAIKTVKDDKYDQNYKYRSMSKNPSI